MFGINITNNLPNKALFVEIPQDAAEIFLNGNNLMVKTQGDRNISIELKRGDIYTKHDPHTSIQKSRQPLIFDGSKLINLSKSGNYWLIPKQFPIIDEFPISYWDKTTGFLRVALPLDHTIYKDQILNNLTSTQDFGPVDNSGGTPPTKYWWSLFNVEEKYQSVYKKSNAYGSLVKVLDDMIKEYSGTTYYIVFYFLRTDQIDREDILNLLKKAPYTIEFTSKLASGNISQLERKDNVLYVSMKHRPF